MSETRLILVVGSDDFLLASKVNEQLNDLVPESERAFGLETIDAAVETIDTATNVLQQARAALVQQGFFSEGKTVWMKNVAFFDSGRLGKSENFGEVIEAFCSWLVDPGIPAGCSWHLGVGRFCLSSRCGGGLACAARDGRAGARGDRFLALHASQQHERGRSRCADRSTARGGRECSRCRSQLNSGARDSVETCASSGRIPPSTSPTQTCFSCRVARQ